MKAGGLALLACLVAAGAAAQPREEERLAIALFGEMAKVLQHPRCLNCHPAGDRPTQTDGLRPHRPAIVRGEKGLGPPGLPCSTCHHQANYDPAGVPGHPTWRLAPRAMGWQGLSLAALCVQMRDPLTNGGRDLVGLLKHVSEDSLVGWAWAPGAGRAPAPGSQEEFGALMKAWIDNGAYCPPE